MMREHFLALADAVCGDLPGVDRTSLSYAAEASDFIRFNQAAVRQATHVQQCYGTVSVVRGGRRSSATHVLSGHLEADRRQLLQERARLAAELDAIPEDPFLLLPQAVVSSDRRDRGTLPTAAALMQAVAQHAGGADLVGFYAGGPVMQGFADSRGQRNWHEVESFHFEWCLYRQGDQAVKSTYAGAHWDDGVLAGKMTAARLQLAVLERPRKTLVPGAYRAYFSPGAVADLLGTLSWGGFGERGVRTGVSSLIQLQRGGRRLHPAVHWSEASAEGLAPRFATDGFAKPDRVALVDAGVSVGTLVSPRTAREYGIASNAGADETPAALAMAPGGLPAADVLRALGTGVYLSDLHYLNYSDRQACRVTGMTRFACLWVEDGEPVAPIAVMRFDDSLLRMFGEEGLVALTDQAESIPDNGTYGARQLRGITAPGAIVDGFVFTL